MAWRDPLPGIERTTVTLSVLLLAGVLLATQPDSEPVRILAVGMIGAVVGAWLPPGGKSSSQNGLDRRGD